MQFLRVVASEYLAAYQLNEDLPAARVDAPWPGEIRSAREAGRVVDISTHPRFDDSAFSGRLSAGDENRTMASWPVRSA
jgi:hypothetical protein